MNQTVAGEIGPEIREDLDNGLESGPEAGKLCSLVVKVLEMFVRRVGMTAIDHIAHPCCGIGKNGEPSEPQEHLHNTHPTQEPWHCCDSNDDVTKSVEYSRDRSTFLSHQRCLATIHTGRHGREQEQPSPNRENEMNVFGAKVECNQVSCDSPHGLHCGGYGLAKVLLGFGEEICDDHANRSLKHVDGHVHDRERDVGDYDALAMLTFLVPKNSPEIV